MKNTDLQIARDDFIGHLGIQLKRNENKVVDVLLTVQEFHVDEFGELASGIYYTLLDVAIGTAVVSCTDDSSVTIDLHVEIFSRKKVKTLHCTANDVYLDGKIGWGKGDIFDERGQLVARGMGTFKIIGGR